MRVLASPLREPGELSVVARNITMQSYMLEKLHYGYAAEPKLLQTPNLSLKLHLELTLDSCAVLQPAWLDVGCEWMARRAPLPVSCTHLCAGRCTIGCKLRKPQHYAARERCMGMHHAAVQGTCAAHCRACAHQTGNVSTLAHLLGPCGTLSVRRWRPLAAAGAKVSAAGVQMNAVGVAVGFVPSRHFPVEYPAAAPCA